MTFYVDYGTGDINNFEFNGTLEECKKEADRKAHYTETDIRIYNNSIEVSARIWNEGTSPIGDESIIGFDWLGFYTQWEV